MWTVMLSISHSAVIDDVSVCYEVKSQEGTFVSESF